MKRRTFLLANLAGVVCAALGIKPAKAKPKLKGKCEILVYAGGKPIGAIQNLTITETINKPRRYTTHMIRFDEARVQEAFRRGYVHWSAQKTPLEIIVHDNIRPIGMDANGPNNDHHSPPLWLKNNAPVCTGTGFVVMSTYGPFSPWQKEPIVLEEHKE
jgi:hypothetical protein